MISFSGKIKNEIQLNIMNLRNKQITIIMGSSCIIFLFLTILLTIVFKDNEILKEMLPRLIVLIVVISLIAIPFRKKNLKFMWDYNILITEENITVVSLHQNGVKITKSLNQIKKVVDYGEYYYLFLFKWSADHGIVCQKDLILQGTIEEFEKLFEGKIIRK